MKLKGRAGDSFKYYSQIFGVPLPLIIDSNPHLTPSSNFQDEEIFIPGYVTGHHDIKETETIWSIAKSYNISVDAIEIVNGFVDLSHSLKREIVIPLKLAKPIVQAQKNYDYKSLIDDINRLCEIYPFMKKNVVGNSTLNKEIHELIIGDGKKLVHMNGSFHANEWITTAMLMTLLNDYLLSLTNQTTLNGIETAELYQTTTLSVVPMVNPDGVDLVLNGPPNDPYYNQYVLELNKGNRDFSNWKANIRGVDLNNQFPALWELEKPRKPQAPSPRDYPGDKPLSEPESIAMANLTHKRQFDRVLAFHTQCKEIYWGFAQREPEYAETIVKEFAKVSGYQPIRNLDSYAGYKDWFIYVWEKPGYTIELGEGVNPLPISQFPEIYHDCIGIFLAGLYM
ncbi:M14 family metallopeptidase [Bacillus sp. Marseille-P3661]|uniref:M14 family metallopeptidase n=1 Tax=Bacillus sp. Marseille-P3661 TaxID=1936234 RepID=UPI000C85F387|nr:M14 family metallopeptidase [Bacillus sp. Marseille-P3661]